MPYISCDDAYCGEKGRTGHDCMSDHWVGPPEMPTFSSWTIEKLSKYIYGREFSGRGLNKEGEQEAFRKSLVSSAQEAWLFDLKKEKSHEPA